MNLKEILNEYKRQNNVTNAYIAQQIGVSKSTVSRWIAGTIKKVQPEYQEKLAHLLGINPDDFTQIAKYKYEKPILGDVKAGYGLWAEQNIQGYEQVNEKEYNQGDYFLRVRGDSMDGAHIHDGDLLYVKKVNDVSSGTIAVVLIENEEVTVKRIIKKNGLLILEAANANIETRYFSEKEVEDLPVQIIGKAIYSKSEL